MTITPVSNTLYTFIIPDVPTGATVYELGPDFINLNGESIFGISYCLNYQGQVLQPFAAYGFVLDSSNGFLGAAPATSTNATDPHGLPGGVTTAHGFGRFGGTYANEFLSAWSNSSDGITYSLQYSIYTQDSQGALTSTNAATLFTGLTPVAIPSSVPWGNWGHSSQASLNDGKDLLALDSVDASGVEQLNFAFVAGDGATSPSFTYSDANWVAGNSYAWSLGGGTNQYNLLTEDTQAGQNASLHRTSISTLGSQSSDWTTPTSFSQIDRITWAASNGNTVLDLSGLENGSSAHQLSIVNWSTGAIGATLDESYTGTLYAGARVLALGAAANGSFLEYWVDSSGLKLEEVQIVNGALQVVDTFVLDANANGTASVANLGNGRVQVNWQVYSGDPTQAGATSVDKTEIVAICFMAGTRIRTPDGEAAIETLQPGDLVLTRDGAAKPVNWLGRQTVSLRFADPLRVLPIRIRAGALAEHTPARDLLVSPDHALLVEDTLIHAGALVNGRSITRETEVPEVFVYYHVELEDHALILAENTPAETFVDTVDRLNFDNWAEFQALYPGGKTVDELPYPRAKSHRQAPARIRAALDRRAADLCAAAAGAA
ncbi:hypothetical protein M2323_000470 [Rhodoblastus acidophilus]|uniref:Hint domain-containing protein n=1 Tax=Rhodoblastus acidophilus TaxID=1074 RepID=UPI002224BA18|nr:Hint domain-containing protein [Rhodoblastus acidophilus]MCW2282709.1 hypothetical protein [Rhodoblastus acidophilus]MCW2331570.1 hypothetical protein [Rhodoblastus acidophilus]